MALYTTRPSVGQVVATVPQERGRLHKFFSQTLTLTGVAGGEENAIGDYTTPDIFYWTATDHIRIHQMSVLIQDSAVAAVKYGNLTALTNGMHVRHYDSAFAILETFNDIAIKNNAGWALYADDMREHVFGTGDAFVLAHWHFKEDGTPLRIEPGEHFGIALSDNMTGLTRHNFVIQGQYENLYD